MFTLRGGQSCHNAEYDRILGTPEFQEIHDFVDRKEQRRTICYGIRPIQPGESPRRLLVIEGSDEVGKSSLLHYALEVCQLRRWRVAYVDMKGGHTLDLFGLLHLIRFGLPTSVSPLWKSQLDQDAFKEFDDELEKIDRRARGHGEVRKTPKWREEAYGAGPQLLEYFHRGLVRQTRPPANPNGSPLVIALDHLKIAGTDFKQYLLPGFIAPIARGDRPSGLADAGADEVPDVYLLLVLSEREKSSYDLTSLALGPAHVPVDLFAPKDFVDLAWEFCRHHKPSKKEKLLKLLTLYAEVKLDQMPWKPTELRTFVEKLV